MKKYEVVGITKIIKIVEFQADTIEDALKLADGMDAVAWEDGKEKLDDYTVISIKEIE